MADSHKLDSNLLQSERLALRRKISVREAAALNDMHEDTFRKHHGDLIKRVGARRDVVALGDALAIGESKGTQ
jgi:hypothetical protein